MLLKSITYYILLYSTIFYYLLNTIIYCCLPLVLKRIIYYIWFYFTIILLAYLSLAFQQSFCHGTRSGGSVNVVALTMVHDRILHEGVKKYEGTSTLYTMGCQGLLRAVRPESVTLFKIFIYPTSYIYLFFFSLTQYCYNIIFIQALV